MGLVVLAQAGAVPPLTVDIPLVFAIVAAALVLFILEPVPIDIVAIGVLISLIVLEPWTSVAPETGVSGFARSATLTGWRWAVAGSQYPRSRGRPLSGARTRGI